MLTHLTAKRHENETLGRETTKRSRTKKKKDVFHSYVLSLSLFLSKPEPDVEPARRGRCALSKQSSHVCDLKRRETCDVTRSFPCSLRVRVHVVQQHGLSGNRLKLLEDLDAVLEGHAALGPPRRYDLDHEVANLPSLDVFQETFEDARLGALGVYLHERDVPPVLEHGVGEDDAAAAAATCGAGAATAAATAAAQATAATPIILLR